MAKIFSFQRLMGILVIASVVATPLVGLLGPFQGGNASDSTREYFLPAGYVFTVWGIIYLGLVLLGVWLLLPGQQANPRARRAAPWLAVTALFNVVWILLAGSQATVPWTVPTLLVMEVSAWFAYWFLQVNRNPDLPRRERALHVPLQLYVGWLSVATVANSAAALNALGWGGFGVDPITWTLIMLLAAALIAVLVGWLVNQDNLYRAVFVWAFVGIVVEQADVPVVAWTAGLMALVVLAVIVYTPNRLRPDGLARRSAVALSLGLVFGGLSMSTAQTTGTFPTVTGANLNNVTYTMPADFEGQVNLVFLVFTQEQQLQANSWLPYAEALAARRPELRVYELPTLTRLDGLRRPLIDFWMRSGIPDEDARARTITLYIDRPTFLSELGLPDIQTIYTLLVRPDGEVLWTREGAYTEAKAKDLEAQLEARDR